MVDSTDSRAQREDLATRTSGAPPGTPRRMLRYRGGTFPVPESLRGLYERYCEREAMGLLSLMTRDALRPFYRRAAAWAEAEGDADGRDPLSIARRYARTVLPLPPYEEWIPLYLANRAAYLEELEILSAPRREDPVAVAVRDFGDGWYAALCLTGAPSGWNGFIQFHRSEGVQSCRTADLFRSEEASEIRIRFEAFDDHTLAAFLRSALP